MPTSHVESVNIHRLISIRLKKKELEQLETLFCRGTGERALRQISLEWRTVLHQPAWPRFWDCGGIKAVMQLACPGSPQLYASLVQFSLPGPSTNTFNKFYALDAGLTALLISMVPPTGKQRNPFNKRATGWAKGLP